MPRTLLRFSVAVVAVAGALAAAGCGPSDPTPTPSPEPTNPVPARYSGESLPDLDVTEIAVADDLDISAAYSAWRFDDVVVVQGVDREDRLAAAALDPATGERIWHTSDDGFRFIDVGERSVELFDTAGAAIGLPEQNTLVAQTYISPWAGNAALCPKSQTSATSGFGLVAIDARDRTVVWHNELVPPRERSDPDADEQDETTLDVTAYSDDVLVVSVGDRGASSAEDPSSAAFDAVGLDATTGEELWKVPQVMARALTDDHLLTDGYMAGSEPQLEIRDPGSGEVTATVEDVRGRWVAAAGDLGLAAARDPETTLPTVPLLVDLSSGEILSDRLTAWSEDGPVVIPVREVRIGVQDGRGYAAWPSGDGHLTETGGSRWVVNTQWADAPVAEEGEVSLEEQSFSLLTDGGYVWLKSMSEQSGQYVIGAYDRRGEPRSEPLEVAHGDVFEGLIAGEQSRRDGKLRNVRLWTWDLP